MAKSKNVSVCIIAKNCADIISTTLRWATDNFEEVNVVVDPNNYDSTLRVVTLWGENLNILVREFDDFSTQKNKAFAMATRPWVLSVDSDEIYEDIPWDKLVEGMDRAKADIGAFKIYNLQKDSDHFLLPLSYKPRLMRKEFASMDGKPVDESIDFSRGKIAYFPYAHIHFGHIRHTDALLEKGKDRIKFIDDDPCDGPGMKKHGTSWFVKRNESWDTRISECPKQVKKAVKKYYDGEG